MHAPWVRDFAMFAAYIDTELGPRPRGMQLDRRDNDSGYVPGNLRWATRSEQMLNRRAFPKPWLKQYQQTEQADGMG